MKSETIPLVKTKPYSVARKCFVAAKGDRVRAAEMLKRKMAADPKLREAVLEPYEESAVWDFIRLAALAERTAIIEASMGGTSRADGISQMAEENARSFFDWPLSCGKLLGDAIRAEVAEEAKLYRQQARAEMVRAVWMDHIAALLPPHKPVRQALDNAKLKALMSQSEREVNRG